MQNKILLNIDYIAVLLIVQDAYITECNKRK